ncbi:MAG: hypothetical protein EON59_15970 [Alphaproteobacteria bacterium]|nr:MAG: hypothetical protein EON59_15970 [Alphaproteobacteria bacterium]
MISLAFTFALATLNPGQESAFRSPAETGLQFPWTTVSCRDPSGEYYLVEVMHLNDQNRFKLTDEDDAPVLGRIGGVRIKPVAGGSDISFRPENSRDIELTLSIVASAELTGSLSLDAGRTRFKCKRAPNSLGMN